MAMIPDRMLETDIRKVFADAGEWDIELTFDGVHFSEEGHKSFAQKLNELLDGGKEED